MSQTESAKTLFKAVKVGQLLCIRRLLEENGDLVKAVDDEGETPLHLACYYHSTDAVAVLLSKNADYELKNNLNKTSYDIARDLGYLDIIKLFLRDKNKYVIPSELAYLLRLSVVFSDNELLDAVVLKNKDACLEKINGDTILHFSVEKNDFETTKKLVYSGVKIDCTNSSGQIPLHIASKLNYFLLSRLLLHTDPDTVDYQDISGNTPLHFAAQRNNAALIKELVSEGATIDLVNNNGMTPLHIAIQCCSLQAFRELLLRKANINVKDIEGNIPLHYSNDIVVTRKLTRKGSDVNCQNMYGQTPLHIAFEQNNIDVIKFYFNRTSFSAYDAQDSNGNTVLHFAALGDNGQLIDRLVRRGASLEVANCNGQTPLHMAIQGDYQQASDRLIYHGADVNAKDGEGRTPLHLSISRGVLSTVGRLVDLGAELETRDNYGQTPIHYAANCESLELLKYLYFAGSEATVNYSYQTLIHVALQSCPYSGIPDKECRKCWQIINWILYMGVNINAQDIKGETVLHYGARNGCVYLVKHLREQEIRNCELSLEVQNVDGQTALHVAAFHNWYVFNDMLGEGADPWAKDYKGVTPFEILTECYENFGDTEEEGVSPPGEPMIYYFVSLRLLNIVDLLLTKNSSLETTYNGDTVLIYAVERGLKKEVQFLLERGANVNATNDIGLTSLHIAIEKSDVTKIYANIANHLVYSGADLNVKTPNGKTPLHLALERERVYPFLLRCLLDNGAIVDAFDFERKTPLDYISSENMENPLVRILIRHHLVMVNTVNMLSIPIDFRLNGYEDFRKCCREEVERMKYDMCGSNSLHDIFFKYGNPTYIFNQELETKVNLLKTDYNVTYSIYGTLLQATFKRARDRYKLIQDAQGFFPLLRDSPFQPRLPDEVQRIILYNLCDNDLVTLINLSKTV